MTTLPTEPEIAALAEELRSEDSRMYIYAALMTLCRRYVAHIATSEAYIAALETQLAELTQPIAPVIDWAKPVIVSQGAPRLGGEVDK